MNTIKCPRCNGLGYVVEKRIPLGNGLFKMETAYCPDCGGDGHIVIEGPPATITINTHGNQLPEAIAKGDWIDLRAAERVVMVAGDYRLISLGVSMELPEGYEAHVAPRSSTFKKWGVIMVNSIGIIDNSYCGDDDIWHFPALAMRDTIIEKGDRIAQFRIVEKQPPIKFEQVESLGNENRGGFGSTGTK